jgi:hypothetical protein
MSKRSSRPGLSKFSRPPPNRHCPDDEWLTRTMPIFRAALKPETPFLLRLARDRLQSVPELLNLLACRSGRRPRHRLRHCAPLVAGVPDRTIVTFDAPGATGGNPSRRQFEECARVILLRTPAAVGIGLRHGTPGRGGRPTRCLGEACRGHGDDLAGGITLHPIWNRRTEREVSAYPPSENPGTEE